ncbi:unnamed protein product [Timema podura]|uniref:Uncharacterized protein n=1 Tax=Timema podura TaxID=61482 RepID=A0ABN7PC74_TIMPD|nr:unnamed protein product [Timema podura]
MLACSSTRRILASASNLLPHNTKQKSFWVDGKWLSRDEGTLGSLLANVLRGTPGVDVVCAPLSSGQATLPQVSEQTGVLLMDHGLPVSLWLQDLPGVLFGPIQSRVEQYGPKRTGDGMILSGC